MTKRFLPMLAVLSLSACQLPDISIGSGLQSPAPLAQTVIDDKALMAAWQSFDLALDGIILLRDAGVIKLLSPPFDQSPLDPGYIKGYLPGVRENGGQYTHAALWTVMAIAQLGHGDEAMELFHMLNPINHSRTPADVQLYKVEPYVVAADVYTHAPHIGRGGWTWYTGSAAWMHRVGLESILGLRRHGTSFSVAPCIPAAWDRFVVRWTQGTTRYEITVENPQRRSHGVAQVTLDGAAVSPFAIPMVGDGGVHQVRVVMGAPKVVQALRTGGLAPG